MEWVSMKIYLPSEEIDALVEELMGVGIRGFAIEDPYEFEEFLETSVYYDYIEDDVMRLKESPANVTIYLPANAQGADMLEQAKGIALARGAEYALENLREEDWANNWKQYFKPVAIGEKILVKPSWEAVPEGMDAGRSVLEIDPSSSFGTGTHETDPALYGGAGKSRGARGESPGHGLRKRDSGRERHASWGGKRRGCGY